MLVAIGLTLEEHSSVGLLCKSEGGPPSVPAAWGFLISRSNCIHILAFRSHCSTESTHSERREESGEGRWIFMPILAGEG
jgi:hypothetical protein